MQPTAQQLIFQPSRLNTADFSHSKGFFFLEISMIIHISCQCPNILVEGATFHFSIYLSSSSFNVPQRKKKYSQNTLIFLFRYRKTCRLPLINCQNLRRHEMKTMHIHKSVILSDWHFSKEQKKQSIQMQLYLRLFSHYS